MKKKMKKIFICLFVISLSLAGVAKEKNNTSKTADKPASVAISGFVCDETSGESLAGVEVKIEGTELKTYTDFDGRFTLQNILPGEYQVVTNYISYQKSEVKVSDTTQKDSQVNIKMKPSI
jgi:hypothetical protein